MENWVVAGAIGIAGLAIVVTLVRRDRDRSERLRLDREALTAEALTIANRPKVQEAGVGAGGGPVEPIGPQLRGPTVGRTSSGPWPPVIAGGSGASAIPRWSSITHTMMGGSTPWRWLVLGSMGLSGAGFGALV